MAMHSCSTTYFSRCVYEDLEWQRANYLFFIAVAVAKGYHLRPTPLYFFASYQTHLEFFSLFCWVERSTSEMSILEASPSPVVVMFSSALTSNYVNLLVA